MGLIQIDSVNVLARSQELTLFARLGQHPRSMIADATADGELFEYWVHEASHVPTEHHHLHRWRMAGHHKWSRYWTLAERRPGFTDEVLRRIEVDGPIASGDLSERVGKKGQWWDWDDGKVALEHLFWTGQLTATRRASDFARIYDLPERVLPGHVQTRDALPEREARKELLLLAAKHHGVGTMQDLTDYHRQKNAPCKPLLDELVENGQLLLTQEQGWAKPAYLHPQAKLPRRIDACAFLSPFDPVCWNRDRSERLFGFRYRIEIYTPAPKRVRGYYALPLLWRGQVIGWGNLAMQDGVLQADLGHVSGRAPRDAAYRRALGGELQRLRGFLGSD